MKTTCRNVGRRWGEVVAPMREVDLGRVGTAAEQASDNGLIEALVEDAAGWSMRLLHKFSRTPVMYVTLHTSDPAASAGTRRNMAAVRPCRGSRVVDVVQRFTPACLDALSCRHCPAAASGW